MRMRALTRTLGITALLLAPALSAMAQEPPPAPAPAATEPPPAPAAPATPPRASGGFGSAGQLVLSVDLPFTNEAPQFAIYHESVSMGGTSSTIIAIQPSADYFVIPNLSVGGAIGVAHGNGVAGVPDASGTAVLIEARVGYNIPLNEMFSIWPHIGIAYEHVSVDFTGGSGSGNRVPLVVTVPVLWHAADHFFVGLGPTLTTDLSYSISVGGQSMDQPKTTDVGLTAVLGGYFGI